jgi:hypothetical protein
MKRFMIYASLVLLLWFGSVGQIQAFTAIDTTPYWKGINPVAIFGYPGTATYGQVITAPTNGDNVLKSFSFHMNLPDTCTFTGYVYAWDGEKAAGTALYKGPTMATLGSGTLEKIDFKTGGVTLTPGAQYVLFASVSENTGSGTGSWGYTWQDVYPGSGNTFVFTNNLTDTAKWTTADWAVYPGDLAFTATFVTPTRKILYWNDSVHGTDYMKEALVNIANAYSTSTTIAAGLSDFEGKVAAGGWDLVVLMIQGSIPSTPNFNSYVSGGGRAILADYTANAARGALFGVTYTGGSNQDVVMIADDLLSDGVAELMSLTNHSYVTFSMGMTRTDGTVAATFPNGDAAIVVGASGKTIINGFLTDTPTSASDGVALFENEIITVLPFKVASPNGGERVPAGGVFNLTWIPGAAVSFNVDISTNKGSSWKSLVQQYGSTIFEWRVPLQKDNMPNGKIRVTAFDSTGLKVAQDVSDNVFKIEVVGLVSPNGGETLTSSAPHGILWKTNETMGAVASVQLFYTLNGKKWNPIATLTGNPGAYSWTVPTVIGATTKCKVKVLLKNAPAGKGKTLGTAISDAFFTIHP